MQVEKKLKSMGLTLLPAPAPVANYLPVVRTGNLLFLSGHVARKPDGTVLNPGKLGADLSIEQGYESARYTTLNCLASIKAAIGDLDKIVRVVKIMCMVNAAPDFTQQPQVANGASDLLVELFGDKGQHSRAAVGMSSLPLNASVEIDMVLEVEE